MKYQKTETLRARTFGSAAGLACGMLALVGALAAPPAFAENPAAYPTRPIRLVLPFPPGGGTDSLARIMSPKLLEVLGQPVVVENRAGASGNIATDIVAKAPPDGYTVLMGFNTALTMNPLLFKKLPFDVQRDLKPITMLAAAKYVLAVNSSVPAKSVSELIALAKSKPGQLNYSSSGPGSPLHLAGELFKSSTGADIQHVPYKGGGPAVLGVLSGEVQMIFGSVSAVMPHVREGKLRALAVTSPVRSPVAPEVPTLDELGLKGFDVTSWYGLLVPKGTPDVIVAKLQAAAQKVVQLPEVRDAMARQGLEMVINTPAEFATLIKAESRTWSELVGRLNITAE